MKQKSLTQLILLLVILELAALAVFTGVACFFAERTFQNKAEVLLVNIRNDFILGDFRSLNKQLQTAVSQHQFIAVSFKDRPSTERARMWMEHPFMDIEEVFPVLANLNDPSSQISEFKVRFSIVEALLNAVIVWVVFSILLLSFVPVLRKSLQRQIVMEQEQLRKEREYQTARQVAHDIRSPMTALKIAAERIVGADQEKELIVLACERITKIAEDLLENSRSQSWAERRESVLAEGPCGFTPIPAVKEVLAEVGLQREQAISLSIEDVFDDLSLPLEKSEFQRAVSNLINNALDSLEGVKEPDVQVYLRYQNSIFSISISDNGAGISSEVIDSLGQRGVSYGKPNGNGLGLYHAKTLVEAVGGRLVLQSRVGVGTLVTMQVPVA